MSPPPIDARVLHATPETLLELVADQRADGFVVLADVTAVDYLLARDRPLPDDVVSERFEVVISLVDPVGRRRCRIRVQVPATRPRAPA
jgi:NADH-quinone oxidoreductase subunit C